MSTAQKRLCPQYERYMVDMEENMQELVMKPTEKRVKIILMAVKDSVEKLLIYLEIDADSDDAQNSYQIPSKLYNHYKNHVYSVLHKKCEKGVNFGRVKNKMDKSKIWGLFKGYWFHNAPKAMTKHLWSPLLTDIAKYFNGISQQYASINTKNWGTSMIQEMLKLTFMKNIFEVKCQINQQSNPSGPVIQYACWKISSLQQVVHRYFDKTYANQWRLWIETPQMDGSKMRINSIIIQIVKPYAQKQWKDACLLNDIEVDLAEFSIDPDFIENMDLSEYLYNNENDHGNSNDAEYEAKSVSNESYHSLSGNVSISTNADSINTNNTNNNHIENMKTSPPNTNQSLMVNHNHFNNNTQQQPLPVVYGGYGGYHGVNYNHEQYRAGPYPTGYNQNHSEVIRNNLGGRKYYRYNVQQQWQQQRQQPYYSSMPYFTPSMHIKCLKCHKCMHHCKCMCVKHENPMVMNQQQLPIKQQPYDNQYEVKQQQPMINELRAAPLSVMPPQLPPIMHTNMNGMDGNNNNNDRSKKDINYYGYPYQPQPPPPQPLEIPPAPQQPSSEQSLIPLQSTVIPPPPTVFSDAGNGQFNLPPPSTNE